MSTTTAPRRTAPVPARAGLRQWAALAVLMLPVLMVSMDNTVLSFALPDISSSLHPSGTALLWVVDIYALMLAGLLVAMGSLGDRIGRRRLLLVGAIGFGAVSFYAAQVDDINGLIVARALLGVFGATLMPSTLSLLRNIFLDRQQRRLAIAVWAAGFSAGAALGPVIGGWLLEHFTWHAVFLINLPVVVVLVPLAVWLLPESRNPNPGPFDLVSIVLSMTTMLPVVYAIKTFAEHGLTAAVGWTVAVSVLSAVAFVRRQLAREHPLVDVTMFRNRVFSGALGANLLSLMGLTGFLFFAAQFLQLVVGLDPMEAALVLVPGLVATILAGLLVVRLVPVFGVRAVVSASFGLSAVGYAIAAFAGSLPSATSIAVAFLVLGVGIGFAETLTNDVVVSSVPAEKSGAASALSETAYEIGAVLGTAVLGGILTATYRAEVSLPPLAGTETQREAAGQTLGGAMDLADAIPPQVGGWLVESAHLAFDHAVQTTSAVAVVIALGAAAVSWFTLRDAER
ncbi:MFS transporter [Mumia sp. zg.B53]|uniref:MFS transporter n=1 Tax=unclassified Mumia TaxID=2621872 RepID=UPI001C6F41B1|nr:MULTISPECIES: MFS transporter [unclassified Mumia]MBW9209997.1 MFS transporter [Mumia sp. zg.B21]MBW9214601.1 MFS transporter [Mumia sp. zg.B53]